MTNNSELTYYTDGFRHLVCKPYSIENLHEMARRLHIKRCWFHAHPTHPHYDIPQKKMYEVMRLCEIVPKREIIEICRGG